jgi:putative GTP pyrophosphokinase
MDITEIKNKYETLLPLYSSLNDEVKYVLTRVIEANNIHYHQIDSRVKSFKSFLEKCERNDYEDPFKSINDLCGIRIICLFISDLRRIGELIETNTTVIQKDDKIFSQTDTFGYQSQHYICRLPDGFSGPRYDHLKELVFEIQVRTIAMHAWASISHHLDYKSPLAIPSDLRKDFNALSALFYVADTHFEIFSNLSKETKREAEKNSKSSIFEEEINHDTLQAYLDKNFTKREKASSHAISELVEELSKTGYTKIDEIDRIINKSKEAFLAYEKSFRLSRKKGLFNQVGVIRVSLEIADEKFYQIRKDQGKTIPDRDHRYGNYYKLLK